MNEAPDALSGTRRHETGVALIEVLISILVIAFGILGIVGIQAASISATSDARYRVEAMALADELLSRIWVATTNENVLPAYARGDAELPDDWLEKVNALPGATANPPTIAYTATDNVVTLTIQWSPPGAVASDGTPIVHRHRVVTAINRNPSTL